MKSHSPNNWNKKSIFFSKSVTEVKLYARIRAKRVLPAISEVITVTNTGPAMFWDITSCNLADRYQYFGGLLPPSSGYRSATQEK
jgi:hypothetical protein